LIANPLPHDCHSIANAQVKVCAIMRRYADSFGVPGKKKQRLSWADAVVRVGGGAENRITRRDVATWGYLVALALNCH
jgi:hypothetical protein